MHVLLFEDDLVLRLYPVTVGRPAFQVSCGSYRLGHTTKIGGEIENATIEPYTNKQHHGFLGHSYLGSWVNLGAGTCNSDLKNTYGQVGMEYQGGRVATGMQFIGCIIGDYAKTAINTSIFTGKTIGACSMVYGCLDGATWRSARATSSSSATCTI